MKIFLTPKEVLEVALNELDGSVDLKNTTAEQLDGFARSMEMVYHEGPGLYEDVEEIYLKHFREYTEKSASVPTPRAPRLSKRDFFALRIFTSFIPQAATHPVVAWESVANQSIKLADLFIKMLDKKIK